MANKKNKNTTLAAHGSAVRRADIKAERKQHDSKSTEQIVSKFVHSFYEKHGKVMSKLAYE